MGPDGKWTEEKNPFHGLGMDHENWQVDTHHTFLALQQDEMGKVFRSWQQGIEKMDTVWDKLDCCKKHRLEIGRAKRSYNDLMAAMEKMINIMNASNKTYEALIDGAEVLFNDNQVMVDQLRFLGEVPAIHPGVREQHARADAQMNGEDSADSSDSRVYVDDNVNMITQREELDDDDDETVSMPSTPKSSGSVSY